MSFADVKHDLPQALNFLRDFEKEQVPFAHALTLTTLAKDSRTQIQIELPHRFTIRRPGFILKGVRFQKATKQNLQAFVYMVDWFWATQETGGTRTPRESSLLKVPASESIRKQSKSLSNDPATFVMESKHGPIIVKRLRGRGKSRKNEKLKLLWGLEQKVQIPARLGMDDLVAKVVSLRAAKVFVDSLKKAISSAK